MPLVTVRSTVVGVSTSSEHNERQPNPDVAARTQDVTPLHEALAEVIANLERLNAVVFPEDTDRWMPIRRACEITGIKRPTLTHYCRTGQAPAKKFRGQWFIDPSWVATQAAHHNKPAAS